MGKSSYGEAIPARTLADRVASYVHLFTLYWSVRIFSVGALLACYDRDGPALYMVEPPCREAVVEVAKIIYGSHDETKDKAFELEMSWVCDESDRQHVRVPKDLQETAEAAAKAALEDSDDDEMSD